MTEGGGLMGGDAGTSVASVFPALVFVVRSEADGATSIWIGDFAILFIQGAAFNGGECCEFG